MSGDPARRGQKETRINEVREQGALRGLLMRNPDLAADDPMQGTLGLWALDALEDGGQLTMLRGWPRARWWTSVLHYWDDFTTDGALGPDADDRGPTGALCVRRTLAPGASADYTFLLSWHFPNRTPERCGWRAPKGDERVVLGNFYCTRFADAWEAARVHGRAPAASRGPFPCVHHRRAREHHPRRDQGRGDRQPLDAGDADLLPDRRRRVPRLRRLQRQVRLLHRQLHTRLELRDHDRASLSVAVTLAAARGLRLLARCRRRDALPRSAARRQGAARLRGDRRPDGPDRQGLHGLAAVGR